MFLDGVSYISSAVKKIGQLVCQLICTSCGVPLLVVHVLSCFQGVYVFIDMFEKALNWIREEWRCCSRFVLPPFLKHSRISNGNLTGLLKLIHDCELRGKVSRLPVSQTSFKIQRGVKFDTSYKLNYNEAGIWKERLRCFKIVFASILETFNGFKWKCFQCSAKIAFKK